MKKEKQKIIENVKDESEKILFLIKIFIWNKNWQKKNEI